MISLGKLIITIALVWLVLQIWRSRQHRSTGNHRPEQGVNDMVRCKVCQLHIPRAEALRDGDDFYCCQAHLEQDR